MEWPSLDCWLIPKHRMGSRVQTTVGCFPELCFLQFSVAQVLVGLRKELINNVVFNFWPVLLVLIIILIIVLVSFYKHFRLLTTFAAKLINGNTRPLQRFKTQDIKY